MLNFAYLTVIIVYRSLSLLLVIAAFSWSVSL